MPGKAQLIIVFLIFNFAFDLDFPLTIALVHLQALSRPKISLQVFEINPEIDLHAISFSCFHTVYILCKPISG